MNIDDDDVYYDLGSFHRHVTSESKETQKWFTRGLIWTYGFNHEEAASCFEKAVNHDPTCAMAYWGLAYCLGPNYNKPWAVFDDEDLENAIQRTRRAAEMAMDCANTVTSVERALVEAIRSRCPQGGGEGREDCKMWNKRYAEAMEGVYRRFPGDLDVATLYADALMNLTPWELWDLRTGRPAEGAQTLEAKQVLDLALTQDGALEHPGLLHLYIHLMEMSSTPELALTVADCLRGLVPDSGHLNHMPTHLDILCGDYRRAIVSNSDAIRADSVFQKRAGGMNFYTLYRLHNYHFRIYAAMFSGQSKVALDTVTQLEDALPEDLLRVQSPPTADWLEGFLAMRVHALIRFGRWEEILDLNLPQDKELYCVTVTMTHYAKGVALAVIGRIKEATEQRKSFINAMQRVGSTRTLFNNTCRDILAVAEAMLDGELEYRKGNFQSAFEQLERAIHLDDSLPYDEPWGWMQPTRHAYGALLLEQGCTEEALRVYEADLGFNDTLPRAHRHPNNVWALHGYHECLVKLNRTSEANIIRPSLNLALAVADIPIRSSCFCRNDTTGDGVMTPIEAGEANCCKTGK
ncbi:putative tpr domain protein [Phaeomoniella chlamydospora]|uniref:Putative tpr domain protein n=1 Tax=Phaeomoniella chlamydospora TaxID=158046 RepID=A0A0G2E0W7_PHACM|nr:putative tpr domain protein [Phaeomoniella chlamydospora]